MVAIPIGAAVVALVAGWTLADHYLPRLADDRVGRLAFRVVCVLLAIALAYVVVQVYYTVEALRQGHGQYGTDGQWVAGCIVTTLSDLGPILGFAAAVYLLAPSRSEG